MAHIISFKTLTFDASNEKKNPINPIAGQSVLEWIRQKLPNDHYEATAPDTEDWGWCMNVTGAEGSYLVGASGRPDKPGAELEWVVQIHRERGFLNKLLGRKRLALNDPLSALIEYHLRLEKSIKDVRVKKEP